MDLHSIEKRLYELCPFIKEVEVILCENSPFALIHPDFEALQKANIINIESELRWYGVELYNMEVQDNLKIRGYKILREQEISKHSEPDDELYKIIKKYLRSLSSKEELSFSSHLELDLGLDSLDYVELFVFIEKSFGLPIDESIFSKMMIVEDLYKYVKKNYKYVKRVDVDIKNIIKEPLNENLIHSPYMMCFYKTLLLPFFKLFFRLEVSGLENIPNFSCIIAPSHYSMLDGFLIESVLPYATLRDTFFLAYEAVFGTKLLRPISDHGQTLLIDADKNLKRSMQRATLPLKNGKNLVIFPEGARSRDGKLLEFRPFFAMLSEEYNVPVIPVVIDGSFEALPAGKIIPRPKKTTIKFLKPIYPDGLSYTEITKLTKEAIKKEQF